MTFAVDFDGTIVDNKFPEIGDLKPEAIETLQALHEVGHKLILWTCRKDRELADAEAFLKSHGIVMDAVNTNVGDDFTGRKIFAHAYLDDRSFPPFPGWAIVKKYFIEDFDNNDVFRY